MGKMYIMMGQAGVGKSTFIKNYASTLAGSTAVVSRDAIRFSLVGEDEEYFSKENEVFEKFISTIRERLADTDNVFVDATHLNRASRAKLLRNFVGVECAVVWVKGSVELAIAQNENRKGTRSYVPVSVIRRMASQIQAPSFEEGFSEIIEFENGKISVRREL